MDTSSAHENPPTHTHIHTYTLHTYTRYTRYTHYRHYTHTHYTLHNNIHYRHKDTTHIHTTIYYIYYIYYIYIYISGCISEPQRGATVRVGIMGAPRKSSMFNALRTSPSRILSPAGFPSPREGQQ